MRLELDTKQLDGSGTITEAGWEQHPMYVYEVCVYEPKVGFFHGPRLVLAENGEAALGQARCALNLSSYQLQNDTLSEVVKNYSRVRRVPLHVQGFGKAEF